MIIKNLHIKHYVGTDRRYLCIKTCKPTKEKIAASPRNVTCKNCRKIMKTKNIKFK